MPGPIYLDYNATTPLDPRVFEVMKEWYLGPPANAGSRTHVYGQRAKDAVEAARAQVASVLNAKPEEIIFTSGATESNNIAILGLAAHGEATGRKHIVSTTIEHSAVLEPLKHLASRGFEVELAPVCRGGYVDPQDILRRVRQDTLLVSVMHANNETGVLQPIFEIGDLLSDGEVYFHVDAAQTFGKQDDLGSANADLISISSHKIYGPQGIGALYSRRSGGKLNPLSPLMFGGGQERCLRPGTLPVALIVGLGKASELAKAELTKRNIAALRFKQTILSQLSTIAFDINGDLNQIQPHILNIHIPGVDSEALMMALRPSVAISNGSACTSRQYSPSHVLSAMGHSEEYISSCVRISWGHQSLIESFEPFVSEIRNLAG